MIFGSRSSRGLPHPNMLAFRADVSVAGLLSVVVVDGDDIELTCLFARGKKFAKKAERKRRNFTRPKRKADTKHHVAANLPDV